MLPSTFRDFGILPDNLSPPADVVRGGISPLQIAGQYAYGLFLASIGGCVTLFLALQLPLQLSLLACLATLLAFGLLVYINSRHDCRQIELHGNMIRATHLYTGRVTEYAIGDIDSLTTLLTPGLGIYKIVNRVLYGRIRGVEIHFRGLAATLQIMRHNPAMANAQELVEGIVYGMQQIGAIDYEVGELDGKPFLRRIYWKDREPSALPPPYVNGLAMCFMFAALVMGAGEALSWGQRQEGCSLATVPPHEITLDSLIRNGPGANRHVTVTDFSAGGYVWRGQERRWEDLSLAVFPDDPSSDADDEIAAVFHFSSIRDESDLLRALADGRVTGICSATRISELYWNTKLDLEKFNPGKKLISVWRVDEPPDAWDVECTLFVAVACLLAVYAIGFFVFYRNCWHRRESPIPASQQGV